MGVKRKKNETNGVVPELLISSMEVALDNLKKVAKEIASRSDESRKDIMTDVMSLIEANNDYMLSAINKIVALSVMDFMKVAAEAQKCDSYLPFYNMAAKGLVKDVGGLYAGDVSKLLEALRENPAVVEEAMNMAGKVSYSLKAFILAGVDEREGILEAMERLGG